MTTTQDVATCTDDEFSIILAELKDPGDAPNLLREAYGNKNRQSRILKRWNKLSHIELSKAPLERGPLIRVFDRCPPVGTSREATKEKINEVAWRSANNADGQQQGASVRNMPGSRQAGNASPPNSASYPPLWFYLLCVVAIVAFALFVKALVGWNLR
ncbi:MAG: hypothetical protein PHS95_00890 [Candidatus Pacebacteria bacterium]|nr:hypothetical protein [Candidatus Paceibacterota bacterium]